MSLAAQGRRVVLAGLLLLGGVYVRALACAVAAAGLPRPYCALLAICPDVVVAFIHLIVYLLPVVQPQPIVLRFTAPGVPPEMLVTLLLSFGVFLVLYVGFVMQR